MKCYQCKFYQSGYLWNRCALIESEYYHEFYKEECPFVDDDYVILEDFTELGLTKGEKVDETKVVFL